MASWIIYGSNNVAKATVKELELHDEWMAECYLTISVKSATPISFAVGDYIDYRGERYTIQYDPNVLKKATSGSYGEGFTYDNIKFVGLQDEVVRCDFNDIVLNDNDIHYSALPTFPFYCESVDDLLDRIQANLEDLYPGQWIIIGLNTVRNAQRGTAVGRAQAFLNAYKQYIDPTGAANTDPYGKQGVAETADNITCWDAMKKVHDDFDLNFIVRGRVIVVGTAGVFTANTFRYGKGNGLYELERIGESDQRIVTRLRAYGSEQNLPAHYYNTINKQVYATVTSILHKFDTTGADFLLDLDFDRKYFTYRSESYPGTTEAPNYIIEMMANDVTVRGYVTKDATTGKCYVYCESVAGDDDRDEPDASKMAAFVQALTANDRLDFVEYVNKDAFGEGHYDYGTGHLPDNMAVSRLMLPGFPTMSLHAWVQAHKDDADKAWLAQAVADGFTFSNEVYRPYIDSPNKTQYGVRPGSIYFDGSDDTEDVHPTIEGMTYNGAPIDEVYAADQVEDNGVYPAGEEVKNIKITLPVLGFELDKVYEDGASIDMKNGMCGARSFKMAGTPKKDANGRWVCTVERVHDDALDLWFPYCDFQIHGSSETGRQHGDNYVLTGIDMPAAYIAAASVRLLQESIEALKKNHAPRYTYQPRIDELWMQRQHDTATASQDVASLHDTLKAGDIFAFADTDLNIDANVIIDVLTIRENGNNGIPTYEVTLRDEKQVGTIQKITNKVDSIISGSTQVNGAGGGLTVRQVQSLIDRFGGEQFLSKLNDDTAEGYIKMLKGLQIGNEFASGILGEGGVLRKRDEDGKVELEVDILYARMKAYFDTVEVREYQHTGGNRIASVAGNRICRVEWYNSSNQVLEQTQANLSSVAYFRCYFRASDGEDTVRNNWVVGDMAYCHVTSIANSSDNPEAKGANQKHLWRLVIGRNADNVLTEDGEGYIDLSNRSTETISSESYAGYQSGSDTPAAQDDIIQLGNVNDTTRQGAIVEFVTGTDAPSYQIYQGIGQKVGSDASSIYSLTSKNQIGFGYNTSTGRAYLNVYGDFRFGARPNTQGSYLEYNSQTGALNIKAHVEFTNTDQELNTLVQSHQPQTQAAIAALIQETEDLQAQIDGAIESYFMTGAPSLTTPPVMNSGGSTYAEPWLDGTETQEERIAILNKHIGDLYYDKATGHGYRFMYDSDNSAYVWTILTDEDVTEALALAAQAQATADGKSTTFLNNTSDQDETKRYPKNYKKGDTWILQVDATINGVAYKAGDILTTSADSTTYNAAHWSKQVRYTDDSTVNNFISNTYSPFAQNIQTQVDKKAETWRQATNPATSWTTDAEKAKHVGDLWMDTANGKKTYIYQNTAAAGATPVYDWVAQDVPDDVFTKIDGKAAIYVGWEDWIVDGVSQLQDKDLYIPNTDHNPYKANKVYRWKASNSTWNEISYTDDTYAHNFDYLKAAMKGDTQIQGGLLLSNAVVLRNVEGGVSTDIMSGINGVLNTDLVNPLKSIAAWYGGDMLDREAASDSSSSSSEEEEEPRYAKSLLRFDGSGYLASGNITWDATGRVTIKDLHTDDGGTPTDVLQEMSAFRGMFDLSVWASATRIKPLQNFEQLKITRPSGYTITDSDVLTRNENDARYMVTDRFKALFRVYNGNSDITDSFFTNGLPQDTSNVSIKAMFDFWSQGGITALGQGSQGGGGGASALYQLTDVWPDDATNPTKVRGAQPGYVLTFGNDNHWYAAPTAETYVLPQATTSALGGIIVSNALGSQVTLTSGAGTTANRYYGVQIDSVGQAFVNIPWTDTVYTLPAASSAALGGIMIGYNGTTPKTYAVQLDANNKAYVAVNWDDAPTDYWHTGDSRTANTVLAAPNGSNGAATFRALVAADIPNLGAGKITSGTFDAARIPDLSGTYAAVSRVSTLEGYFNASGYALYAAQLGTARSLWGNSFNGSADITSSIIISTPKSGETDKYIKIGDIYIGYDATNDAIEVYKLNSSNNHVAADFYARGGVSALGAGSSGGGGGGQGDVTWALLADNTDTRQIAPSHLSLALFDYATQTWVQQQGYVTSSGVTSVATGTGLTGGTITSTGTISINSTYQTYISHGESAYNSLSSYLPLTGGTLSGNLTISGAENYGLNLKSSTSQYTRIRFYDENDLDCGQIHYFFDYSPASYELNLGSRVGYGGLVTIGYWQNPSMVVTNESDGTGKVGIRTKSPSYPLHVNGQVCSTGYVKSGYSDSYVLTGGGGAALISGLSVSYATTAGSATDSTKLPLSGGTMTGGITLKGSDIFLSTPSSLSNDSGDLVWSYGNGNEKMRIWSENTYSSASGPNFRVFNSSGTLLYEGQLALKSEIPTNNNQLTNGAGYITSSGSCAYASSAGSVDWGNVTGKPNVCTTDTAQTISGQKNFNSSTNTTPLIISRVGSNTHERVTIGVDDTSVIFHHMQDESDAFYRFYGEWDNSESGGGNTGSRYVEFGLGQSSEYISLNGNLVWHQGNDGANSGLDADLFDGIQLNTDEASNYNSITWQTLLFSVSTNAQNKPLDDYTYGIRLRQNGEPNLYYTDIATAIFSDSLFYRRHDYNGYANWHQIAFTDSNVASATQLATSRSIWGQPFNGTAAITGSMSSVSGIDFSGTSSSTGHGGYIDFHFNGSSADYTSRIIENSSGIININNSLYVVESGCVGIGTNTPSGKLTILPYANTSNITLGLNTSEYSCIRFTNSNGDDDGVIHFFDGLSNVTGTINVAASNAVTIGGWTSPTMYVQCSGSKRVGIGTSSPSYLLDVAGSIGCSALYSVGSANDYNPLIIAKKSNATYSIITAKNSVDEIQMMVESNGYGNLYVNGSHGLRFTTNAVTRMTIAATSGDVTMTGSLNGCGGINFSQTGHFRITDYGNIYATTNTNNDYWCIRTYGETYNAIAVNAVNGFVGIGLKNNETNYKLYVDGSTYVNGDVVVPLSRATYENSVVMSSSGLATSETTMATFEDALSATRSYIGSCSGVNGWKNVISVRHRNGAQDGAYYGMVIWSQMTNSGHENLFWSRQPYTWVGTHWTIWDSANANNSTSAWACSTLTASGDITTSSNLYVTGNVGIGTTSPSYKLHVSGDIYATGGVTCASDARMKDVISPTDLRVEQVADAPSVRFLWKKDHSLGMQVGTIAQYWQKVLPEAVSDKSGELSLQYGVTALLSTIVVAKKVVDHEKRISELEKECERLKTENEQLKMMIA